jgi:branched-chain amino acid transport system ATP-binding protein
MSALLALENFSVTRGDAVVVRDVSLAIAPGEALAILGDNGAGKSSLLAGIMGLASSSGGLRLEGQDIGSWPTHRRARAGLGYCPDHRGLFPGLSAHEVLLAACPAAAGRADAVGQALQAFPELQRRAEAPSWQLSGGEQQMLSLLRALMGRPRLLLLDEPALGLAPGLRERLAGLLADTLAKGIGLILVEQDAHFAQSLCQRSIFLHRGQLKLT